MTYTQKQSILSLLEASGALGWLGHENIEAIRQMCIKEVLENEEAAWLLDKLHGFANPKNGDGYFIHSWNAQTGRATDVKNLIKKKGYACTSCGQGGYFVTGECVVCVKK